jgi:hypothetical protein
MYTFLVVFTAVIVFLVVYGYLHLQLVKKRFAKASKEDQTRRQERLDNLPVIPLSERDDEAIYQWSFHHGDRLVARAVGPEIDEAAKRVSFAEITHSDLLLLPDECHFRKYKLEIDTVGDAKKTDTANSEEGRILRQVTAQVTGYVEH